MIEDIIKMSLLAVLQGITEFLPVSSSGHLVLCKELLDFKWGAGATIEIMLHAGTLLSVILFYRRRLLSLGADLIAQKKEARSYSGYIVLGVLPILAVGYVFREQLDIFFQYPWVASICLMITGIVLLLVHFVSRGQKPLGQRSALLIGFAQVAALLPGISRSGVTISTARLLGIRAKEAAEFSFLMSIPLLLAVIAWESIDWVVHGNQTGCPTSILLWGFFLSAAVGYVALRWLVSLLERGHFWRFGIYCIAVGLSSFIYLRLG